MTNNEILKKQMEFLEIFSKILKYMEKIILNVKDMIVMDIFKRFCCPTDQHFIVQNVRSNDNKYLLTKTLVKAI